MAYRTYVTHDADCWVYAYCECGWEWTGGGYGKAYKLLREHRESTHSENVQQSECCQSVVKEESTR